MVLDDPLRDAPAKTGVLSDIGSFGGLFTLAVLLLAIPMVLLYELGIWAAQVFVKHTQAPSEEKTTTS